MATSVYTSLLISDYRRRRGEITKLRKEIRELCRAVQALEHEAEAAATLIRSREPALDLASVPEIRTTPRISGLRHGALRRSILELLRDANGDQVGSEIILLHLMSQRSQALSREQQVLMGAAIQKALNALCAAGKVVRHHPVKGSRHGRWSIAGPLLAALPAAAGRAANTHGSSEPRG